MSSDFDWSTFGKAKAKSPMIIILVVVGILFLVGLGVGGYFLYNYLSARSEGEECEFDDEGVDNCDEGLFCRPDSTDPTKNICYASAAPPPPPPVGEPEPKPSAGPPAEVIPENALRSGDVVKLMNLGFSHFKQKSHFLNNVDSYKFSSANTCSNMACGFKLMKVDETDPVIRSGDKVKFVHLGLDKELVGSTSSLNEVMRDPGCLESNKDECQTWGHWYIRKGSDDQVGKPIVEGDAVHISHVNRKEKGNMGHLLMMTHEGMSAGEITLKDVPGPVRYKQWVVQKFDPLPLGCNAQPTATKGEILCPVGYTTKYNYGVNVAAKCDKDKQLCDRCIGLGGLEAKPIPGTTEWTNSVSKYSGGQRVTDGMPVGTGDC